MKETILPTATADRVKIVIGVAASLFIAWVLVTFRHHKAYILEDYLMGLKISGSIILISVALFYLWYALVYTPYEIWRENRRELRTKGQSTIGKTSLESAFSPRMWDDVDPLALYQIACLWEGLPPPEKPDGELGFRAIPRLQTLISAVNRGFLPPVTLPKPPPDANDGLKVVYMVAQWAGAGREASRNTLVRRNALRLYAEARNSFPSFLFPNGKPND